MDMLIKTKEVSEQLGVNPTTIQRWTKYFGLQYETNEHGHYLFTDEQIKALSSIQQQLQEGKRMKDVDLTSYKDLINNGQQEVQMVDTTKYDVQLNQVLARVSELEERLSKKADEVVSYQLLKHRAELEDMFKSLQKLENRIVQMESKMLGQIDSQRELPLAAGGDVKKKRHTFRTLVQTLLF